MAFLQRLQGQMASLAGLAFGSLKPTKRNSARGAQEKRKPSSANVAGSCCCPFIRGVHSRRLFVLTAAGLPVWEPHHLSASTLESWARQLRSAERKIAREGAGRLSEFGHQLDDIVSPHESEQSWVKSCEQWECTTYTRRRPLSGEATAAEGQILFQLPVGEPHHLSASTLESWARQLRSAERKIAREGAGRLSEFGPQLDDIVSPHESEQSWVKSCEQLECTPYTRRRPLS